MRRLHRSRRNRWIVGVCGGIGERYGFPPIILRVILIVLGIAFVSPLLGIAYIFCWLLIPEEPEESELSYYGESAGGGSEPDPMGPQQAIGAESEEDIPADPWPNDEERVSS